MNAAALLPIIRHLLQILAGVLIAKGWFSEAEAGSLVQLLVDASGPLLAAGTIVWMQRDKKKQAAPTVTAPPAAVAAIMLGIVLMGSGCATNSTVDWRSDIATTANLAAYVGASVDLQDNPERRPAWVAAEALLGSIIKDENYTPAQLVQALEALPIKELRSGKGTLIVGSAVILWNRVAARIDIDKVELVKVVAPAVRDGIKQALAK